MASTDSCYPIVGIQDGLAPDKHQLLREVHLRMDIDEWYQSQQPTHSNQRALFFPAFLKFSRMKPQDKLSYFQIAGKAAHVCFPYRLELNDIQVSTESPLLLGMSPHRREPLEKKATVRTTVSYSVLGTDLASF